MKDLRKDFNYKDAPLQMSEGHQQLFETKLRKESKAVSSSETLQKIAAVLIIELTSATIRTAAIFCKVSLLETAFDSFLNLVSNSC